MDRASPPVADDESTDLAIYIVLDEVGQGHKCIYRETEEAEANKKSIVENIIRGVYSRPVRVIAFDLARGWARDVSADVASAVLARARNEPHALSASAEQFVETVLGQNASMRALD